MKIIKLLLLQATHAVPRLMLHAMKFCINRIKVACKMDSWRHLKGPLLFWASSKGQLKKCRSFLLIQSTHYSYNELQAASYQLQTREGKNFPKRFHPVESRRPCSEKTEDHLQILCLWIWYVVTFRPALWSWDAAAEKNRLLASICFAF